VVLVVDDRELNLELLSDYLAAVDCEVVTATDGITALALIERSEPDLVLLDVMMPGVDGFEVCRTIKANPRHRLLPVCLVTALNQSNDRLQGLDAGADDFIVKPVDRVELVARVRSLLRLKLVYDRLDDAQHVILSLARAVEAKDSSTESHTERVARAARSLGAAVGITGEMLENLYLGGVIHDIGKIGIPDALLLKPGPLEPDEVQLMRTHVLIGEEIVRPLRSASGLIPIVRHHHERWDGDGYPDGLRGEHIPLPARIVAICDAYDSMVSDRPYRRALSPARAAEVLREGAGSQWDAHLVTLYLSQVAQMEHASLTA
jgi:putative two-component system response regulator